MKVKILVIAMVAILAVAVATPAMAKAPTMATGGGTADWEYGLEEGRMTCGFTAHLLDDSGNAEGDAVFHHLDNTTINEIDVLYLAVDTTTGDAWIGGVIIWSTHAPNIGFEVFWRVQDNGEGKRASGPDMISGLQPGAINALSMPNIPLHELTNGNVQVR